MRISGAQLDIEQRRLGQLLVFVWVLSAIALLPQPATAVSHVLMVKDIDPGPGGSFTQALTDVNGSLFFTSSVFDYDEFVTVTRLWVTNGTDEGTVKLEGNPGIGLIATNPDNLVNDGGVLFFTAIGIDPDSDPTRYMGRELWRSNGTENGTIQLADIVPGTGTSLPNNLVSVNGTMFFGAIGDDDTGRELWMSDGIPGGSTTRVKDINPGNASSIGRIASAINVDGTLFFWANDGTNGFELWKSNGESGGTLMVKNINDTAPGASSAGFDPNPTVNIGSRINRHFDPVAIDGTLYFPADDGVHGVELWRSDGEAGSTNMVTDLNPGPASSSPGWLTAVDGKLFFTADDGVKGRELFETDGYVSGTKRVADSRPGLPSSRSTIFHDTMAAVDGTHGTALWKTDDSPEGASLAVDFNESTDGYAALTKMVTVGGLLYFAADDGVDGAELWQSDGTFENSHRWDINPGPDGSIALIQGPRPIDLVVSGPQVFFPAYDGGQFGDELWVTSATIPDDFDPDRTRTHGGDPPGDPPGADVEITNVISRPVDVDSLALFEYLYIVTNNGPDLAPGVVLTDLYDSGVRVAFPDAICVLLPGAQDAVTCDIGNLAPGFSAIVSVITRAPMVATVTVVEDFARVKHDGEDTKPVNNIRAERTRINPPPPPPPAGSADLAVVKRALWIRWFPARVSTTRSPSSTAAPRLRPASP